MQWKMHAKEVEGEKQRPWHTFVTCKTKTKGNGAFDFFPSWGMSLCGWSLLSLTLGDNEAKGVLPFLTIEVSFSIGCGPLTTSFCSSWWQSPSFLASSSAILWSKLCKSLVKATKVHWQRFTPHLQLFLSPKLVLKIRSKSGVQNYDHSLLIVKS